MGRLEFRSVEPGSSREDLLPLLDLVGDARVVGLGDCTHGSREIHRMRHRIVELLAEELGFSAVVLEANLAETTRVNEYTLEGRGIPAELLPRYLPRDVCTEEMADLLQWMWTFNTSGRGRVLLAGCDMQRIETAAEVVIEQVRLLDPEFADSVAWRYERLLDADRMRWLCGMGVQTWFPTEEACGRRLRFSGYLKTEDVSDHACLWGWAGGSAGTLAHDALEGRRPRGTTGWREYDVHLDVPKSAEHVSLGCYLAGNGTAWFDGLSLEIDGKPWRNPEQIDFDLSTEELRGFWVDPRNHVTLDPAVSRTGRKSLRIEPEGLAPACETSAVQAQAMAAQVLCELEDRFPSDLAVRAFRCARAIVQAMELRTGGGDAARARTMAENIVWLLNRKPDNRIIFWSNNDHVRRGGGEIGAFLARSLGEDYLPVGFSTGSGTCLALSPRWREGHLVQPLSSPPRGSFERHLMADDSPLAILDLRNISPEDPENGWLTERRPFRNVGATSAPQQFFEERIQADFDLLVWIEETTAARSLPRT
jgi:erythromycin esterase-like protein